MYSDVNGIILAGGSSSRFGRDKPLLKIGNKTLLEIISERLSKLFPKVLVVANSVDKFKLLKVELIADKLPIRAPIVGVYTGLLKSEKFRNFIVGCDMPLLKQELIKHLIELSDNYDLVIPRTKKGYEPLHALYSKNCLGVIKESMYSGKLKLSDIIPKVRSRVVDEDEISRFDPEFLSFFNLNSFDDVKFLKGLLV